MSFFDNSRRNFLKLISTTAVLPVSSLPPEKRAGLHPGDTVHNALAGLSPHIG